MLNETPGTVITGQLKTHHSANEMAYLFQVLSNPYRIRLLHLLMDNRDMTVGELAEALCITNTMCSSYLRPLRELGIVSQGGRVKNTRLYTIRNWDVEVLLGLAGKMGGGK